MDKRQNGRDAVGSLIRRRVRLEGVRPFLFDRYSGLKIEKPHLVRSTEDQQKEARAGLWLADDKKTLALPAINIFMMLAGKVGRSAVKRLYGMKEYGAKSETIMASLWIEPVQVPFLRDGKPLEFGGWTKGKEVSRDGLLSILESKGRVKGTALMEYRARLEKPWALEFVVEFDTSGGISEEELGELLRIGGKYVSLGGFRPFFGNSQLTVWKPCECD